MLGRLVSFVGLARNAVALAAAELSARFAGCERAGRQGRSLVGVRAGQGVRDKVEKYAGPSESSAEVERVGHEGHVALEESAD